MKNILKSLAVGLLSFALITTVALAQDKLKVGDKAPDTVGKNQNGEVWSLADLLGKSAVILYFYPKDNTPGCTLEACGLRDRMSDLKNAGVEVVGVSLDDAVSHKKFIADHNLNFSLLADTEGKIVTAYGVKMEGKNMARRVSFLIGKDGIIKHITDTPKADVHLKEMKAAVDQLGK